MSHSVVKANRKTLDEMKGYYAKDLKAKTPNGAVFSAKHPNCTITAYQSGKVLFQGKGAEQEAKKWQQQTTLQTAKKKESSSVRSVDQHSFQPPKNIETYAVIGSDEVGTGDFFGPMTVVAAFVAKEQLQELQQIGVKDSKHLSDREIVSIAKKIVDLIPYSLLVLPNEKYNDLQRRGMNQGKMKARLHNRVLDRCIQKTNEASLNYDAILVDQFVKPESYFSYLKGESNIIRDKSMYFATQAEQIHLSVAAASIIARYAFLKEWEKMEKYVGMTIPKGAGPKVDDAAVAILNRHGEKTLYKLVKWHFANTDKAKKIANKR
ncbi:ribonuclease HIII [Texcoconibacillus texcoconensis]|uniref:Ribonuclease HIII n=1 Tax=Texcoconibacillus texcoconensis TaxID=1095777 RepID=A0A840QMU0_9BACI|nr:ribonuclease HIII [Texcoconibacillus texcoconensis]MBB5172689.1 ribonuclease HIII [Texcoconibacillus texcoconensis]